MRATDRPNSAYMHSNGDYYAWICLDELELDEQVPYQFPYSEGKTWGEYARIMTVENDPDKLKFILVGYRDENGNRKERITEQEFNLYRDYFAGRNIWTFQEAKDYKKQFETETEEVV